MVVSHSSDLADMSDQYEAAMNMAVNIAILLVSGSAWPARGTKSVLSTGPLLMSTLPRC